MHFSQFSLKKFRRFFEILFESFFEKVSPTKKILATPMLTSIREYVSLGSTWGGIILNSLGIAISYTINVLSYWKTQVKALIVICSGHEEINRKFALNETRK